MVETVIVINNFYVQFKEFKVVKVFETESSFHIFCDCTYVHTYIEVIVFITGGKMSTKIVRYYQ